MSCTCDFASNWARFDAEKRGTPAPRRVPNKPRRNDNPLGRELPPRWRYDRETRAYYWSDTDSPLAAGSLELEATRSGDYFAFRAYKNGHRCGGGHGNASDERFLELLAEMPEWCKSLAETLTAEKAGGTE